MSSVDFRKLGIGALSAVAGCAVGWYGQPMIKDNTDAISTIVTIFSILAGFQIALMTLLGDPSFLGSLPWKALESRRTQFENRLIRQKWLFVCYLVTLLALLAAQLIKKDFPDSAVWLERSFLGFGTAAFIFSFLLPWSLLAIQVHRYDELIEAKRREAGIK